MNHCALLRINFVIEFFVPMRNLDSYSVSFFEGNIQDHLTNAFWRRYSPKQKVDLLDEMTQSSNKFSMVNVFPRERMIELSFKRSLVNQNCDFIAGKWIELEDFDSFHQMAFPLKN